MRYFFNAIIQTKRKFSELLPLVYQIMDENGWEEKRLRCFGENFNVEAQVEMNKLMKDSWKVMSHLLPDAYAQYVLCFEKEAVPKLAEVFGETSPVFYQESFTWDWRWRDGILAGGRRG